MKDRVAAILALGALVAVAYAALARDNPTALGALIGLLNAAAMWFLRGRLQQPRP